ncbi:Rhamnogalacturonan acetylesterase [Lachnellula hyalina]|uniref:Rhamnogalacturonan acetylesterase n=1 Tax=Lachnellula hyalina TaxID=1316788 RepID=A0A8H8R015_9HELO|nr:Rhamnogalacturonan acetylesterase [Lachnellula hyalina]TVY25853.1 Rhamnogalacturonan acetylesterase [Lachnellula hyalina]
MKSFYLPLSAALATLSIALPTDEAITKRATPIVYLAGDSTMAKGGGGTGTEGWGVYLPYSLSLTVVNDAIGGRSARSYTDEGRFTTLANTVVSGDFVIIEFGHNDGGSLTPTDNGRSDCVGSGDETCTTDAGVVVQTYPTYLTNAAELMTAKGAHVIISSPTPDNPCETGTCSYTPSRFTGYCEIVVSNVGSLASFVDHGQYLANRFIALGATTVDAFYPNDHTHTSPEGAAIVAEQFVKGLLCADNPLAAYVKNTTASVAGSCI